MKTEFPGYDKYQKLSNYMSDAEFATAVVNYLSDDDLGEMCETFAHERDLDDIFDED